MSITKSVHVLTLVRASFSRILIIRSMVSRHSSAIVALRSASSRAFSLLSAINFALIDAMLRATPELGELVEELEEEEELEERMDELEEPGVLAVPSPSPLLLNALSAPSALSASSVFINKIWVALSCERTLCRVRSAR